MHSRNSTTSCSDEFVICNCLAVDGCGVGGGVRVWVWAGGGVRV